MQSQNIVLSQSDQLQKTIVVLSSTLLRVGTGGQFGEREEKGEALQAWEAVSYTLLRKRQVFKP